MIIEVKVSDIYENPENPRTLNKKRFEALKKSIKEDSYSHVINLAGHVDHYNKKKTLNSHFTGCKNLVNIFLKSDLHIFYSYFLQVFLK